MENNNKFKKVDIKNRTCYYFDGIMKVEHIDFDNNFDNHISKIF